MLFWFCNVAMSIIIRNWSPHSSIIWYSHYTKESLVLVSWWSSMYTFREALLSVSQNFFEEIDLGKDGIKVVALIPILYIFIQCCVIAGHSSRINFYCTSHTSIPLLIMATEVKGTIRTVICLFTAIKKWINRFLGWISQYLLHLFALINLVLSMCVW